MAAYRENYSTNHIFFILIENWKKALEEKFLVDAVLMDLSKAFDYIPHDLLIAKLHTYGSSQETVTLIYSYLKRRKQKVKVNNFISVSYIAIRCTTTVHIRSNIVQYIP